MSKNTPQLTDTLHDVKEYLRENYDAGCICPACNQHVKMYKRKLSSTMAFCLITFYRYLQRNNICNGYIKWQNILDDLQIPTSQRADWQKLVYFGLIEPKTTTKGDKEQGKYKLTIDGINFVKGLITQPEHCKVYNGKVFGYSKNRITIKDALKNKFNFEELMNK